jgi:hypothetical protein
VLAQDANAERMEGADRELRGGAGPPQPARPRSRISAAALLVKVIAAISPGA